MKVKNSENKGSQATQGIDYPLEKLCYSLKNAAGVMDMSPDHLRELIYSNRIRRIQLGNKGGKVWIPKAEIERFIKENARFERE